MYYYIAFAIWAELLRSNPRELKYDFTHNDTYCRLKPTAVVCGVFALRVKVKVEIEIQNSFGQFNTLH